MEDIPAEGIVAKENDEIAEYCFDYQMGGLKRLSFWKPSLNDRGEIAGLSRDDLVGYALIKKDIAPSRTVQSWHVFESVFLKYPHEHNYVAGARDFAVRVDATRFEVRGVLYCQQNTLNKACAQVALRSLCSFQVPDLELSFNRINDLAAQVSGPFDPGKGLTVAQIRAVLNGLNIHFHDIDYTLDEDGTLRSDLPYQKFLYAGIESGGGSLLGFQLTGSEADHRHIVPFFGHTFNQDMWVPNADVAYFKVGEGTRYIPSEAWLSSFIGHDDNFGSNFCVPKLYVRPEHVEYVVELLRGETSYSGTTAEAVGVNYLYSIIDDLGNLTDRWSERLMKYSDNQQVVLRALALKRDEYVRYLRSAQDWHGKREARELREIFAHHLPDWIWVVEVSVPELFPTNLRKLGEIVLDATRPLTATQDYTSFALARLPGVYMLIKKVDHGKPEFLRVPSKFASHTPLCKVPM